MEDDPDREPERIAMRAEMRRLMETRIDLLPEAFRSVFMLRAVEELSVEEVAVALDLPQATVRTVADPKERADLIAYLKHVNDTPECARKAPAKR